MESIGNSFVQRSWNIRKIAVISWKDVSDDDSLQLRSFKLLL